MNFKISKLEVEGFRAFHKKIEIDFPPQLVVIYGRNGTGKSSVFDSFSWLFDGDLLRYQVYGKEWTRIRKGHTRSLLNPTLPSKVTCHFDNLTNQTKSVLSRSENNKDATCSSNIKGWLSNSTNNTTNLLAAHMLCQSDLHHLAKLKGNDRLEALAPILDLTKTEKELWNLNQEIKDKSKTLKILASELTTFQSSDAKPLFEAMYSTKEQLNERAKVVGIDNNVIPDLKTNNHDELQALLRWIDEFSESLTVMRSNIANETGKIKAKYNIQYYEQIEIINQSEELQIEQELKEAINNVNEKKQVLAKIDNQVLRLANDIIKIQEYSERRINIINNLLALNHLYINHPKAKEWTSVEVIQANILKTKDEVEQTSIKLQQYETFRSTVIDYVERILNLILIHKRSSDTIKENQSWLDQYNYKVESNEIQELRDQIEMLTSESQEKIEWLTQIKFHREGLSNSLNDGSCPLCGNEYESKSTLIHAIEEKTNFWEESYRTFSIRVRKLSEKLANLQTLMIEKERRLQGIRQEEMELKAIDNEVYEKLQKLKTFEVWESDFDIFVKLGDWQTLKRFLIDQLNEKISKQMGELESKNKLLNSLMEYQLLVRNQESRIKEKQNELMEYSNILDDLIQNYNLSTLNKNDSYYEMIILEFHNLLDIAKQRQVTIHKEYSYLVDLLKESEFKWLRVLNNKLQNINSIIDMLIGFREMVKSVEDSLQKIGRKNFNENERIRISKWLEEAKNKKRILKENEKDEINNAIGPLSNRIGALFENLANGSSWRTIRAHAFVPDQRERTHLIFSPVLNNYLSNNKHHISDIEEDRTNSTFLFSMGESSILGLATFLARATEPDNIKIGTGPELNTLFIDDPIQELDFIRDDALAYLLCDIALERQVIVSTSNLDFANRLILTSRPIWEKYNGSCGVLYLNKQEDFNHQAQLITPEKWILDQRIYMPKLVNNLSK